MEMKVNAGYTITDSISIGGETYVIGHNPDNPMVPYVTWAANEDLTYFTFGHYLQTRDEALLDLMKRTTAQLEIEGARIAPLLLSQDDREKLYTEFTRDNALANIESCLYDAFDHLDIDSDKVPELMSNPDFQLKALNSYYRIDHSYENEALSEVLEKIIEEHFQEMLPKEISATLKISPEEMAIQNDVLHLTTDEMAEKYGAHDPGEGMLEFHQEIPSLEFMFDEDIDVSDDFSALHGYVWAMSSLVDRLKVQEPPLEKDQFMENINFYPVYNLNTGRVSLEGHYYLEDSHNVTGKAFTLQLTPNESNQLRMAFEAYCLKKEGKSCLEFLLDRKFEHNSERKPLAEQIQYASIRTTHSASASHETEPKTEKTVF